MKYLYLNLQNGLLNKIQDSYFIIINQLTLLEKAFNNGLFATSLKGILGESLGFVGVLSDFNFLGVLSLFNFLGVISTFSFVELINLFSSIVEVTFKYRKK